MTDRPTPETPCERARLLLSLHVDGEATEPQRAELAAHLAACAPCRRAEAADLAVRTRLLERAEAGGRSARFAGLAGRVIELAGRRRIDERSQNRLVVFAAAASVLAAATIAALLPGPDASTREGTGVASARHDARESTRLALLARGREREGR